jgi:hypothetical protein
MNLDKKALILTIFTMSSIRTCQLRDINIIYLIRKFHLTINGA